MDSSLDSSSFYSDDENEDDSISTSQGDRAEPKAVTEEKVDLLGAASGMFKL